MNRRDDWKNQYNYVINIIEALINVFRLIIFIGQTLINFWWKRCWETKSFQRISDQNKDNFRLRYWRCFFPIWQFSNKIFLVNEENELLTNGYLKNNNEQINIFMKEKLFFIVTVMFFTLTFWGTRRNYRNWSSFF